jgi:hypothetical protein
MGRKSNKQMNALKAKVFQALLWIKKRGGIYCNKWMPGGVMLELIRNEFGDFSNLMSSSRDLNYNINYVPNPDPIKVWKQRLPLLSIQMQSKLDQK